MCIYKFCFLSPFHPTRIFLNHFPCPPPTPTALCSEGQTKTYTCSNPVLTFNSTSTGIDLVLNVTNNRRRESLPIRIHRTPEGLNISSLIIPDEGKVEFRIKTHFVEVMNSGSPQRVFKNDQKQIWFYEFSAPSGVRLCVACGK